MVTIKATLADVRVKMCSVRMMSGGTTIMWETLTPLVVINNILSYDKTVARNMGLQAVCDSMIMMIQKGRYNATIKNYI